MGKKLTNEHKARIYCAKYRHAKFFHQFWGYVHCGRCGEQIGDKLGGVFYGASEMASPQCKDSPCEHCDPIIKKLSKKDKILFDRRKNNPLWNTERVLKGIEY